MSREPSGNGGFIICAHGGPPTASYRGVAFQLSFRGNVNMRCVDSDSTVGWRLRRLPPVGCKRGHTLGTKLPKETMSYKRLQRSLTPLSRRPCPAIKLASQPPAGFLPPVALIGPNIVQRSNTWAEVWRSTWEHSSADGRVSTADESTQTYFAMTTRGPSRAPTALGRAAPSPTQFARMTSCSKSQRSQADAQHKPIKVLIIGRVSVSRLPWDRIERRKRRAHSRRPATTTTTTPQTLRTKTVRHLRRKSPPATPFFPKMVGTIGSHSLRHIFGFLP